MKHSHELNQDIFKLLKDIDNLSHSYQYKAVATLFNKYLSKVYDDQLLGMDDLRNIVDFAKTKMANDNIIRTIGSEKHVTDMEEFRNIALIEAVLSHLQSKGLLKAKVKFDYRD